MTLSYKAVTHIYQPWKRKYWRPRRRKSPKGSDYYCSSHQCCGEVMFKLLKTPKGKASGWKKGQTRVKPGVSWTQNFLVCDKTVQSPWAWSEREKTRSCSKKSPPLHRTKAPVHLPWGLFILWDESEEDSTEVKPAREGAGREEPASCPSWPSSHPRGRTV